MRYVLYLLIILLLPSCYDRSTDLNVNVVDPESLIPGCPDTFYTPWQASNYVLPYPVGQSFKIGLSHCSGELHAAGQPDQFAIDINMSIGTLVTAVQVGTIVFVEEGGLDYESTDNVVVLRDEEGYYFQYRHLTVNGALVDVGDFVAIGDPIGYSGASGLARYPHLHLVTTRGGWNFPYTSYPITFRNTSANPYSLEEGKTYQALPY